ncbi:MAG: cytochrome b/b6 domain-containing protein [Lysobacterales bacterium]
MNTLAAKTYQAWDLPTRLFHWINFLCVMTMSFLGLVMLNKGWFGISGVEASIGLKTAHVLVGYVFATNLIIRLVWGFFSGRYSRWSSLLPGSKFKQEIADYTASVKSGEPQTFVGHNPKGRLSVMFLFLLLTVIMVTGIVRAGTDIYFPPLGHLFASQVAAEGVAPADIKPYDETGTDAAKLSELKAFKEPFGEVHVYTVYVLWLMILIHIIAVIRVEIGGEGTLISAMFSGKKYLPRAPADP